MDDSKDVVADTGAMLAAVTEATRIATANMPASEEMDGKFSGA